MTPSSDDRTLAVRGMFATFADDFAELATRISWALPTATPHLSEQERAILIRAQASAEDLHREIEALALGEEVAAAA
jgi:hypothetical protein